MSPESQSYEPAAGGGAVGLAISGHLTQYTLVVYDKERKNVFVRRIDASGPVLVLQADAHGMQFVHFDHNDPSAVSPPHKFSLAGLKPGQAAEVVRAVLSARAHAILHGTAAEGGGAHALQAARLFADLSPGDTSKPALVPDDTAGIAWALWPLSSRPEDDPCGVGNIPSSSTKREPRLPEDPRKPHRVHIRPQTSPDASIDSSKALGRALVGMRVQGERLVVLPMVPCLTALGLDAPADASGWCIVRIVVLKAKYAARGRSGSGERPRLPPSPAQAGSAGLSAIEEEEASGEGEASSQGNTTGSQGGGRERSASLRERMAALATSSGVQPMLTSEPVAAPHSDGTSEGNRAQVGSAPPQAKPAAPAASSSSSTQLVVVPDNEESEPEPASAGSSSSSSSGVAQTASNQQRHASVSSASSHLPLASVEPMALRTMSDDASATRRATERLEKDVAGVSALVQQLLTIVAMQQHHGASMSRLHQGSFAGPVVARPSRPMGGGALAESAASSGGEEGSEDSMEARGEMLVSELQSLLSLAATRVADAEQRAVGTEHQDDEDGVASSLRERLGRMRERLRKAEEGREDALDAQVEAERAARASKREVDRLRSELEAVSEATDPAAGGEKGNDAGDKEAELRAQLEAAMAGAEDLKLQLQTSQEETQHLRAALEASRNDLDRHKANASRVEEMMREEQAALKARHEDALNKSCELEDELEAVRASGGSQEVEDLRMKVQKLSRALDEAREDALEAAKAAHEVSPQAEARIRAEVSQKMEAQFQVMKRKFRDEAKAAVARAREEGRREGRKDAEDEMERDGRSGRAAAAAVSDPPTAVAEAATSTIDPAEVEDLGTQTEDAVVEDLGTQTDGVSAMAHDGHGAGGASPPSSSSDSDSSSSASNPDSSSDDEQDQ